MRTDPVTGEPLPPLLYKYSAFDRARIETILCDSRIWYSSPLVFNDPFDCLPVLDLRGSDKEFRTIASRVAKRRFIGSSRAERRAELSRLKSNGARTVRLANASSSWRSVLEMLGTLCLSEEPADLLMWGHYADCHRGICLGFDGQSEPFSSANKVRYTEDRPAFRYLETDPESKRQMVAAAVTSKAPHWAYEREWRAFEKGRTGLVPFNAAALKRVILGAQTSTDDIEWLEAILQKRRGRVEVLRCALDANKYVLEIIPRA